MCIVFKEFLILYRIYSVIVSYDTDKKKGKKVAIENLKDLDCDLNYLFSIQAANYFLAE